MVSPLRVSPRTDARILTSLFRHRWSSDWTTRVRSLYEMHPPTNLLSEEGTYFNVGYWEPGTARYDHAQHALADLLAEAAGMGPGDTVLDCGFGFGDQDFRWLARREPYQIFGINITPRHVAAARARARAEKLHDRLRFQLASATDIPFPDNCFDRVVSLESAMHYQPRTRFFEEAFRVLRPGGVLATADIVPMPGAGPRAALGSPALDWIKHSVDDRNWHDREAYAGKLGEAGFAQVRVRSIRDRVWEPWLAHIRRAVDEPAFARRVSTLYLRMLRHGMADRALLDRDMARLDYVLASAVKPHGGG
ncbi:methyltransferase domain-containing protein [Streptomyces pactum]|uniref:Methyltransferase domain-containing protein n=1 Tax=Streptomyces pactum TaxID=68249 RepID=A0ABS0NS71_9ACTN|nr:class I SAM-dependent methyltransferase [Streptomyces pactum]MBH5338028.1 methyltransferase domain-containing protein [Streptomyces pactum]